MSKTPPKPQQIPLPLAPWQRKAYVISDTLLKLVPFLLTVVLVGMMIWTALPKTGTSTVQVDPNNIFVSDNAHLLSSQTKTAIHKMNTSYKKLANKPQLMVITLDHLPPNTTIEQFTIDQATKLGVGDADEDSGVVYLIAKAERQARLEVGYGMESQIPDAMTNVVTDDQVRNDYRRGDYDAGVQLVTQRLDQLIRTGDVDNSRISHAHTQTEFHPLTAVWTWLNTAHSIFSLLGVLVGLCIILYAVHRLDRRLQARLRLDDLLQHYMKAIRAIDPQLDNAVILASPRTLPVKAARRKLREQLLPINAKVANKTGEPDYFSMQFAFGRTTIAKFYANANKPDHNFKRTSIHRQHQDDWYKVTSLFHWTRRRVQTTHRDRVPAADVRPYSLTPLTQVWWWVIRLVTNVWVLLLSVLVLCWIIAHSNSIGVFLFRLQFATWMHNTTQSFGRLFASGQSPLQLLNSFVASLLFGGLIIGGYLGLNVINTRARRHLQLNQMINNFLGDLGVHLKQNESNWNMATALANATKDDAISLAKASLKTSFSDKVKVKKRKGDLPDYYDMAFAFGNVSVTQFFRADDTDTTYTSSSMYVNHANDWYAGGSSDGSGGSDSFGGGGFGGGGGTSSW